MVSLRPPVLDEVGLEAALRDQVEAFARRSGVACELRGRLDGRLGSDLETVVYRVAQEASPRRSSELVRQGHFGLVGTRERVEVAGGHWSLASRPGGGVAIRASFQLSDAA